MKRNKTIDDLKGIGAILVVWGHVLQYASVGKISCTENVVHNLIYSFHMPLFMFCSGFVAWYSFNGKKDLNIRTFICKRATQLLLPFISWGVITGLYINCSNILKEHDLISLFTYYKNLLVQPENGLWFLYVLFVINFGHCFLIVLLKRKHKQMFTFAIIFFIICLCFFSVKKVSVSLGIYNIQRMVPFYCAGVLCNKYQADKRIIFRKSILSITIICVLVSATVTIKFGNINSIMLVISNSIATEAPFCLKQIIQILIAFPWIIGGLFVVTKMNKLDVFSHIGIYSLDIYALQVFPTKMLGKFSPIADYYFVFNVIYAPFITATIVITCMCLSKYVIRKNRILTQFLLGKCSN